MNTFGRITVQDCVNVAPAPDARCSDPAFALANPDICPATPYLSIKPGRALTCALSSIQFTAVLSTNGTEQDVSADCIWRTSDEAVALIGAASGSATGVGAGDATISATYQSYTATAELTVMAATESGDCCSNQSVAMMLLVDTSRSMSQTFSGSYQTRLDFAKAGAARFASEVNETKDTVGIITFNDSGHTLADALTADKATVQADAEAIVQTQQLTSFYGALSYALDQLDASSADLKVLILFSDGEDTAESASVDQISAIGLASNFKDAGGVIMCFGCRASGAGFSFLSGVSTGGFFVNGYEDTETNALDYLSGLKGYICAGNCTPAGDAMVAEGQLNYDGFINWDVEDGTVDLIGNGFFDFLPDNGLYVDLAGSGTLVQHSGTMVSNAPFSLRSGRQYRVAVELAGNQREESRTDSAILRVFYLNGTEKVSLFEHTVTITDYSQPFQTYAFTFTAPADVSAYISIAEGTITSGMNPNYGLLLGSVTLDDISTSTNLLTDTFDTENLAYIAPRCGLGTTWLGSGYGYATGYNCYGEGCLDSPPPAQSPDPSPLPDIESGYTPPQVFTSTMTACESCDSGQVNLPTVTWEVVSTETGPPNVLVVELANSTTVVQAFSMGVQSFSNATLAGFTISGSNDGSTWTLLHSEATIEFLANLFLYFPIDTPAAYRYFKLEAASTMPVANILGSMIGLTLYGVEDTICVSATATGATQEAADAAASAAASALARAQLSCQSYWDATEPVSLDCPIGTYGPRVTKTVSVRSFVSQEDATQRAVALATTQAQAEIDADCALSNNDQANAINDAPTGGVGLATLFPQVQRLPPLVIASISVKIYGLTHTWPSDLQMFIRGPDGTCVGLLRHCGGSTAIDNVDITFSDGSPAVPTPIVVGTYAPTAGVGSVWAFSPLSTPQAPTAPSSFSLNDFIGKDAGGSWSLWVIDTGAGNTGTLAGGFEVVIT